MAKAKEKKEHLYLRLSEPNKAWVIAEAAALGVSMNSFMNSLIGAARRKKKV